MQATQLVRPTPTVNRPEPQRPSGPTPLSLADLQRVAGGLPKGGWSTTESVSLPKGGW